MTRNNIKYTNQIFNRLGIGRSNLTFFVIVILAVFLRFYNLSNVPPSASLDEASIGYNAYSIIKTGRDEYGTYLPVLLRAYDDWRPALYVYLVIPFVKLLGLNVLAIRLPSVVLSVATVIAVYFLVKELFPKANKFSLPFWRIQFSIGEIATLLLAISPWHIYISRLGHEANAGLAFVVFGILFFFKAIHYNTVQYYSKRINLFLILSVFFFALSFISYQAEKIFIPILGAGVFFIFRDKILKRKKELLLGILVSSVFLIPFLKETFSPNSLIRFSATNIFDASQDRFWKEAILLGRAVENRDILGQVIHNRRIVAVRLLVEGYISHLNPKWLFTNSSSESFKAPNIGLLNLWESPLIVMGIFVLIFSKLVDPKNKKLIFLWFFLAPLPAAIATQAPHAMRSYNFLPTWQIFAALGLTYMFFKLQKLKVLLLLFSFALFVIVSLADIYKNYFIVFPKEQSSSFQYALSQTIPYVLSQQEKYEKIVFSNQDNLYQSYMLFLFHSRYDPWLYRQQGGTKSGGFAETHKFDKFEFRPIEWNKEKKSKNILYIGNPTDFGEEKAIFNGYYLDKKIGTKVVYIK